MSQGSFDSIAYNISVSTIDQLFIDSLEHALIMAEPDCKLQINYLIATSESVNGESENAISRILDALRDQELNVRNEAYPNRLLGIAYFNIGDLQLAENHLNQAKKIDSSNRNYAFWIKDLVNLSGLEHAKGEYVRAMNFQRAAIRIQRTYNSKHFNADLELGLAPIFIELGQLDSAEYYYKKAFRNIDSLQLDRFSLFMNMGALEVKKNNLTKALEYFYKGVDEIEILNDSNDRVLLLNNLAYINYELGNFKTGFELLDSMNTINEQMSKVELSAQLKDIQAKYQDLERDQKLKDLAYQAERDNNLKKWGGITGAIVISALSGLYFTNRKRLLGARQLAIETKARHAKEKELVAVSSSLQTLELERKRTAMDLHDGIGALASSVRMRVSLTRNRIDDPTLKEHLKIADDALEEIANDVKRIAHNMLPSALNHLGLISAIQDFINRLPEHEKSRIHFYSDVDQLNLEEAKEITLYRIIQEMLSNGIKYSEAEVISLEITIEDKNINLFYHDNGVGIDKDSFQKGNGLTILQTRIAYLSGNFEWKSQSNKGTQYIITIPYEG